MMRGSRERMTMLAASWGLVKHHHRIEGINSRLDGLQARSCRPNCPICPHGPKRARQARRFYEAGLDQVEDVVVPSVGAERTHVYHLYTIQHPRRVRWRRIECPRRSERDSTTPPRCRSRSL